MSEGVNGHSPTPWKATMDGDIAPPSDQHNDGYWIAHCGDCGPNWKANAAFIVKSVNCHDELVAALTAVRDRFFPADRPEADRDMMWDQVNQALGAAS